MLLFQKQEGIYLISIRVFAKREYIEFEQSENISNPSFGKDGYIDKKSAITHGPFLVFCSLFIFVRFSSFISGGALFFFVQTLDFTRVRLYNKIKMRYCAQERPLIHPKGETT